MINANQHKLTIAENRISLLLISITILAWLITFFSGLKSAASVWWISEIFHHCAFVVPISFWLIYQKRHELLATEPKPNYTVLPLLLLLLFLQVFGFAGDIQLFQYVATFLSIPAMFWLVIGTKSCKEILFPLFFIVFAIPVGDELIPLLQEITADLSVFFLQLFNIPVFRKGLFIEIPNGMFQVVEACSGISFLIVSVVFGNLYAYLSFKHYKQKVFFLILSFTVPILANSLRAFGVVLIGHYFGMEYAVGTDHLIYGWLFYCFVLFLLIFIGESIRDPFDILTVTNNTNSKQWLNKLYVKSLAIIIILFIGVISWQSLLNKSVIAQTVAVNKHVVPASISLSDLKVWQPDFKGYSEQIEGTIIFADNTKADIYMVWYDQSSKGELVSSGNHIFNNKYWTLLSKEPVSITFKNTEGQLYHLVIKNTRGHSRSLIYGFIVKNKVIANEYHAKIYHGFNVLKLDSSSRAFIAISYPSFNDNKLNEHILTWLESTELQTLVSGENLANE